MKKAKTSTMARKRTQGVQPVDAVKAQSIHIEQHQAIGRLETLNRIASQLDAASNREQLFLLLREESKFLLMYDVSFICLLNSIKTHYVIHTLSTVADSTDLHQKYFMVEEGTPGWVIENKTSIAQSISSLPRFHYGIEGRLAEFGIQAMLIVPLLAGEDVVGCLSFGSTRPEGYNNEDLGIAQLLARYAATALKNASLFDDTRKRIAQIELINSISRQLASELNLDDLLTVAASAIQKSFNYFDVSVFMKSASGDEFEMRAHSGNFEDFLPKGFRVKANEGIVGWVAANGEKVLSNDVSQDPRYLIHAYHNTKSELAMPIKIENVVVGVINVEDAQLHAFDETDVIVLQTLCDQLGIAIKNANLYEEVQSANIKLTELDKMKSEFLGIVSHDFRSPLSSIILAAKSLLRTDAAANNKRLKDYLELIVNQSIRLTQLAEDTLSITKIESGQMTYFFKIVNVERLIQDAISLVKYSSQHHLEYTVDQDVLFIKGDQSKLRQVVQNLVSNAVKYSPHGGKVVVRVTNNSTDEILISISDEGIGIPEEYVGKLFQKFYRVNDGEAREIKGTGLGLWICKEIVEAHGGTIWVESIPGKGSTFKLTLKKAQE